MDEIEAEELVRHKEQIISKKIEIDQELDKLELAIYRNLSDIMYKVQEKDEKISELVSRLSAYASKYDSKIEAWKTLDKEYDAISNLLDKLGVENA